MVRFDNPEHGKHRRKTINLEEYFSWGGTAIDLHETEFSLHKSSTATCTAINFPLRLAWGITLHRLQGHTIKKPQCIVLDLNSWLQPAMIYVGLSRVQVLTQLYILAKFDKLPEHKTVPWPDAMEEMERLEKLDLRKSIPALSNEFEIVSLNIISLRTL